MTADLVPVHTLGGHHPSMAGIDGRLLVHKEKDLWFLAGAGIFGVLLVLLLGGVTRLGPVVQLEQRINDAATAHFTPEAQTPHPAVAVVAIDDATVEAYPPYSPINRAMLARLLTILQAAAPRAIGVDVLLAGPTGEDADRQLEEVLRNSPVPVVLVTAMTDGVPQPLAAPFDAPEFTTGLANLPVNLSDDVLRDYQTGFRERGGALVPTLSARLAELATGSMATLSDQAQPIDWYGRPSGEPQQQPQIATFPAHTFLSVPAAANLVRGKLVLVGATFAASGDFVRTPFAQSAQGGPRIPGVMAHAQVLAQLIDGRSRPVPSGAVKWLLIAGAVMSAAGIAMARPSAIVVIPLALGVPVLWVALGLLLRRETGFPLPAAAPALAFGISIGAFSAYQTRRLDRLQRQALRALSQRVPAGVIDQMMAAPDLLRIDGDARVITVLFTDLAAFTRYSRERSAPQVMGFLRDYLEEVSEIVLAHGGTIDKFIGDAVMAFWGAPLEQPDHACRAIACAREIDARCRAGAAQHGLVTRIGVHTGEAMVGFVGSRRRLEYTAIGDTVNTTSRVEGANKYLRTTLAVTGESVAAAGGRPAELGLRFLGRVRLVGRDEPMAIHTALPDAYDSATTELYEKAARALDDGAFAEAQRLFDCLPADEVVHLQLERSQHARSTIINLTDK